MTSLVCDWQRSEIFEFYWWTFQNRKMSKISTQFDEQLKIYCEKEGNHQRGVSIKCRMLKLCFFLDLSGLQMKLIRLIGSVLCGVQCTKYSRKVKKRNNKKVKTKEWKRKRKKNSRKKIVSTGADGSFIYLYFGIRFFFLFLSLNDDERNSQWKCLVYVATVTC